MLFKMPRLLLWGNQDICALSRQNDVAKKYSWVESVLIYLIGGATSRSDFMV